MARKVCNNCQRPQKVCFCHLLTRLDNRWPVTIVQHVEESKHAIGTAKIAQLSLNTCRTHILKDKESFEAPDYLKNANGDSPAGILVYPDDDSTPVSELKKLPPLPLIFIDASWRKSRQIFYNSEFLQSLPKCSFSLPQPSRYRIRKEPEPGYFSTLEAIVYMLGELEEDTEKYQGLLEVMDWMIDRQVEFIGEETFRSNY